MMVALIVSFPVAAEKVAELEAVLVELQAAVHAKEPDALVYQLCKEDKTGTLYMLELYKDAAALKAHNETEHFQKASKAFRTLLSGAPDVRFMNPLGEHGLKDVKGKASVAIVATMRVKAGSEERFERVMAGLASQVHANEGMRKIWCSCIVKMYTYISSEVKPLQYEYIPTVYK